MDGKAKIQVYLSSIHSTPKLRKNHETVKRYLMRYTPYETFDIASDEDSKKRWRSIAGGDTELPCVVVNGKRVGTVEELEEAGETDQLDEFLHINEAPTVDTDELPELSPEEAAQLAKELGEDTKS